MHSAKEPATAGEPPEQSPPELEFQRKTIQRVALLVSISATVVSVFVFLTGNNPPEAWAAGFVALIGWVTLPMLRMLRSRLSGLVPHFLVFGTLAASNLAVLAHGSVRTAAGFMYVAAVTGAGIFLGRTALIMAVGLSIGSLALLTLAEQAGWLRTADLSVGFKVWTTQAITLVVVAIMVFYSRQRSRLAMQRQREEMARRERIEQERDQSLARLGRIFRTTPSPLIAQSAVTGAIMDVNPAFERCFQVARDEVLGLTDLNFWADPAQRQAILDRLREQRRVTAAQAVGRRADGSLFDLELSCELSGDREDELLITSVNDVSVQKAALEQLRKSEERFSKAFNFSPLNMMITRLSDGRVLQVNPSFARLMGLTPESMTGKTSVELAIFDDETQRASYTQRIRENGTSGNYDTVLPYVDGTELEIRSWSELIEIEGEPCILTCVVDIRADKRREDLLREMARVLSLPTDLTLLSEITRSVVKFAAADLVLLGEMDKTAHLKVMSFWRAGRPASGFDVPAGQLPCRAYGDQPGIFVIENMGEAAPLDSALHADFKGLQLGAGRWLRDEDGTTIGLLMAGWRHHPTPEPETRALLSIFASRAQDSLIRIRHDREIAHLNESLEQRVKERTAELEKLNSELDSFAYSVSHDLRSPLRAIDGFAHLLCTGLDDRLQPDEREAFAKLFESTRRMNGLISDLLALSRISQGQLLRQNVDLSQMVSDILAHQIASQAQRQIELRIAPDLHTRADPRLVRVALENLLANTLKYTRKQPHPVIEFGLAPTPQPAPPVFFIRDNGVGFDMALAHDLFKPFKRLHSARDFEGSGIGLATVRRVVERHGGQITGEGHLGQGAEFRFSFTPDNGPAPDTVDSTPPSAST